MEENPNHYSEDVDIDLEESPPEDPDNIDEGEDTFSESEKDTLINGMKAAIAHLLLSKSKKCAARYLKEEFQSIQTQVAECKPPDSVFSEVLNAILNPELPLSNPSTFKWMKWLMAGGRTPKEFYKIVEQFDKPMTCSLVWTDKSMAYRCRTCSLSLCMSLCLECFNNGNHEGHDFNLFRSTSGGVCDCGNKAVMAESGFCSRHEGPNPNLVSEPPEGLLALARGIMPRLLLRFILHCRFHGSENSASVSETVKELEPFISYLQELCSLGAVMRTVVTQAFCNPETYKNYTEIKPDMPFYEHSKRCQTYYSEALESIQFGEVPEGYEDLTTLHGPLVHNTFLEEIVFWNLKLGFPPKLVCLLLSMRLDQDYKDAFARAFIQHYSCISVMLGKSEDSDNVGSRVVHVSVQLFSDQKLAYRMTDSYQLLHVMVLSLKKMMKAISVPSTLHTADTSKNTHKVVNCMKFTSYWPLVSDLSKILSDELIAKKFMKDTRLLQEWFSVISLIQGMNNNLRQLTQHVQFETQSYFAAYTAELQVSGSPLWAMIRHLKDESSRDLTLNMIKYCLLELKSWVREIGFFRPDRFHFNEVTFHLPLHRNFSLFMCQAVKKQQTSLADVLPTTDELEILLIHPLRAQVALHEIHCNLWARNGMQMKGQALAYVQATCCNTTFDPDLYLLQVGASELPKDSFLLSIIENFYVMKYLSFSKHPFGLGPESEGNRFKMLESCLLFLAMLTTNRHNIGLSEQETAEIEIISLMTTDDKTYSKIKEFVPDKCASNSNIDFDAIVNKYSEYNAPECQMSGAMREGLFVPLDIVWEDHYDPMITVTRFLLENEHEKSFNRFKQFCSRSGKVSSRKARRLWPPYRLPSPTNKAYNDPRRILACRTFHGVLFTLLYKAVHETSHTDSMLALIIHLFELCVDYQTHTKDNERELAAKDTKWNHSECPDGFFYMWYSTDNIFKNSTKVINRILLKNYRVFQPASPEAEENVDIDMVEIEGSDALLSLPPSTTTGVTRPLSSGSELVPYQEGASAVVPSANFAASNAAFSDESDEPMDYDQAIESYQGQEASNVRTAAVYHPPRTAALPEAPHASSSLLPTNLSSKALVNANSMGRSSNSVKFPRFDTVPHADTSDEYLVTNESLITLLIKLHSKLSERRSAYRPQFTAHGPDSRIGDGPFFIAKVLNKLGQHDTGVRQCILESMSRICPPTDSDASTSSDGEANSKQRPVERRKRAAELQRKLMASFGRKQEKFLSKNKPDLTKRGETSTATVCREGAAAIDKEYDCLICNQAVPSTLERPIGVIAFVQPTSVHGNRTTFANGIHIIPVNDRSKSKMAQKKHCFAKYMKDQTAILNQCFEPYSCMASADLGWQGGVQVTTCGHHLHLDCHKSYVLSLQSQDISHENGARYSEGEYFCPCCRRVANTVLPIFEDTKVLSSSSDSKKNSEADIDEALLDLKPPKLNSLLTTSLDDVLTHLTSATDFTVRFSSPTVIFVFLSSTLRTNLEIELIQIGGCLVNQDEAKRSSLIVPLLHILAHLAKLYLSEPEPDDGPVGLIGSDWIRKVWISLSQSLVSHFGGTATDREKEVPILFRDPVTLLIHTVLLLPPKFYRKYYKCLVLNIYRLVVARAAVTALRSLPEERRSSVSVTGSLAPLLALANDTLRDSSFFSRSNYMASVGQEEMSSILDFTSQVREMCLDFLRIAALMKAHIMEESLPLIADKLSECGILEQYLELWETCSVVNTSVAGIMYGTSTSDNGLPSSSTSTTSSPAAGVGQMTMAMKMWCSQAAKAPAASWSLLSNVRFFPPQLLNLPQSFDEIFQYYHQKKCGACNSVPKYPGICLVCGTLVCMNDSCCSKNGVFEGVRHSLECGAGTAVYLAVSQTSINVVHQERVCTWGCIHLDFYGEEDKDLKRGKPLYLRPERYQLLKDQWISQSFRHTSHEWYLHKNRF